MKTPITAIASLPTLRFTLSPPRKAPQFTALDTPSRIRSVSTTRRPSFPLFLQTEIKAHHKTFSGKIHTRYLSHLIRQKLLGYKQLFLLPLQREDRSDGGTLHRSLLRRGGKPNGRGRDGLGHCIISGRVDIGKHPKDVVLI